MKTDISNIPNNFRHPDFIELGDDGVIRMTEAPDMNSGGELSFLRIAVAGVLQPRRYTSPEHMFADVMGYFKWISDFPLLEARSATYQGITEFYDLTKKRTPTLGGMQLFLGLQNKDWVEFRNGEGVDPEHSESFKRICEWVEMEIYRQKFENAAAGLLNPMIIARDLGLTEKSEITGKDGEPLGNLTVDPSKLSTEVLEALMAARTEKED